MLHTVSPSPGRMRGSAGGANSGAAAARSSHLHPERDASPRLQQLSYADRVSALAGHEQRRGPVLSEQARRRVSERDWAVGTGRAAMMRCGYVTGKSSNGGGSVPVRNDYAYGPIKGTVLNAQSRPAARPVPLLVPSLHRPPTPDSPTPDTGPVSTQHRSPSHRSHRTVTRVPPAEGSPAPLSPRSPCPASLRVAAGPAAPPRDRPGRRKTPTSPPSAGK